MCNQLTEEWDLVQEAALDAPLVNTGLDDDRLKDCPVQNIREYFIRFCSDRRCSLRIVHEGQLSKTRPLLHDLLECDFLR